MLLVPLVLLAPVMLLIVWVLALAAHGPLGWLAAAGLLTGVGWSTAALVRVTRDWWASTKAPVRPPGGWT